MKASLKLRDDGRPLLRAKIPVSILGLPFLSGVCAGEAGELRLDLATAFESGPSFRVSYRPNDSWNAFALSVKTGGGALGSPIAAAVTISTEFSLVGHGGPRFTIQFKPRFGDFCVRKSTSAQAGPLAPPYVLGGAAAVVNHGADQEGAVTRVFEGKKPNGISTCARIAAPGGVRELFSGAEITASSSLPLNSLAAMRLKWGVRIPTELWSGIMENQNMGGENPVRGVSVGKLPFLVMSKISVVHLPGEPAHIAKKSADSLDECLSTQRQLVALQAEQTSLRNAIEELRAGLSASVGNSNRNYSRSECRTRELDVKSTPLVKNGGRNTWWKDDGKGTDGGASPSKEEVGEELRKVLMGASSGTGT